MEGDEARAFGDGGRLEPAHDARLQAVALEAAAPLLGPVAELALARQVERDELLLVAHRRDRGGVIVLEVLQRVGVRANGVEVARGVARAILLVPFLDHDELALLLEERVQAVQDDDVQVQEQGAALQVVQRVGERGQLEPAVTEGPGFALVELVEADHGDGLDFDGGVDAGAVIGQADKTERPVQVAADHAVQLVDVLGAVLLAPLDAQHIDRLHESPLALSCRRGRYVPGGRPGSLSQQGDHFSKALTGCRSSALSTPPACFRRSWPTSTL
ncbi:alpha/beta hydrolase [Hydrogenophaga flava]|uniref:alpha/beta hydrolase n=1 Tax=Hydrogenophaga flava TaxID=65657 RepID=UPI003F72AB0A